MPLKLVVDNGLRVRRVQFDRDTRIKLSDAADGLRTLGAIIEEAARTEPATSQVGYSALGYAIAKHLQGRDPWEVRDLALAVEEIAEQWDRASGGPAGGATA